LRKRIRNVDVHNICDIRDAKKKKKLELSKETLMPSHVLIIEEVARNAGA